MNTLTRRKFLGATTVVLASIALPHQVSARPNSTVQRRREQALGWGNSSWGEATWGGVAAK